MIKYLLFFSALWLLAGVIYLRYKKIRTFKVPKLPEPEPSDNALFISIDQFNKYTHPSINQKTINTIDKARDKILSKDNSNYKKQE
jgi:hypothetical protein